MSAAPCRQGRGGGRSPAARASDTARAGEAGLAQHDSCSDAPRPLEHTFGCLEQQLRREEVQPLHAERHALPCLQLPASVHQHLACDVASIAHASNGDCPDTVTDAGALPRTARGRGGRLLVSSRRALMDGQPPCSPCSEALSLHFGLSCASNCILFSIFILCHSGCGAARLPAARFDSAEATRMYIFLAASLAWLPASVALDHPDDDHLHVVCATDGAPGDAAATFRVPRPLVYCHDGHAVDFRVGEHAQMLVSEYLGFECQVWAKVIIKQVWNEGYAVVALCSQCRDVVVPKVMVRVVDRCTCPTRSRCRIACAATPWYPCIRTCPSLLWFQKLFHPFVALVSAPRVAEGGACAPPAASETSPQTPRILIFFNQCRTLRKLSPRSLRMTMETCHVMMTTIIR